MIELEVRDRLAVMTINRPKARNAIDGEVAQGIEDGIDRLEEDDDLWVGIITGVPPVFSAGADLKAVQAGGFDQLHTERGGFAGITRRSRTKPLIAAVNGAALAGGCEIVLSCDLVVASTAASFGIPEVKRSLIAGAGGLLRLPMRLPFNMAMELALTGDPISAERAHHFGLVNQLCGEGEDVLGAAVGLAERICANAPLAVRASRQVMLGSFSGHEEDGWLRTGTSLSAVMASQDIAEGLAAFVEKRPPHWQGR